MFKFKNICVGFVVLAFLIRCGMEANYFPVKYGGHLSEQVIYGEDNRLEPFQIPNSSFFDLTASTVALVHKSKVASENSQGLHLGLTPYGEKYRLCKDEKFFSQGTAPYCSGFLVTSQKIVTAGHCMARKTACEDLRILFDFGLYQKEDLVPDFIPKSKVYRCKSVVANYRDANGADFAVVELDRPVMDRQPLSLRQSGRPYSGDPLVLIGHPSGLPVKIAAGGQIRNLENEFFVANVDSFSVNSGSAILNEKTGLVEGILVRGEMDYEYDGDCRRPKVCSSSGCRGEDATLISYVLPYL